MPAVQTVLFVWLVVRTIPKGQWRSVIEESGALSVMMAGTGMMLQWSVNSWGSREQVSVIISDRPIRMLLILLLHCGIA